MDTISLVHLKRQAMGTQWEILVPMGAQDVLRWGELAFKALAIEEARLTVFSPDSEASRLNRASPGVQRKISPILYHLLARARDWWNLTEGCLDIGIGRAVEGWGFLKGPPRIPPPESREKWLVEGGIRRLILDDGMGTAGWAESSGDLNFGAIGKGFALDQMGKALAGSGWNSVLIHGGRSSVLGWGNSPGEELGWRVALRHPAKEESVLAEVLVVNGAMGTTAATYKHLVHEGQKLGHVLDPRNLWPASLCDLVSVLAPDATEADALSTAVFVGGPELAQKLATSREDLGILILSTGGRLSLLGNWADRFLPR